MRIVADFTMDVGRVVPSARATVLSDANVMMLFECLLTNDCDKKLPEPPESRRKMAGW
jgi:hypothetical protein